VNVFQPFGITRPHYTLLIWPKFGWQLKKSGNILGHLYETCWLVMVKNIFWPARGSVNCKCLGWLSVVGWFVKWSDMFSKLTAGCDSQQIFRLICEMKASAGCTHSNSTGPHANSLKLTEMSIEGVCGHLRCVLTASIGHFNWIVRRQRPLSGSDLSVTPLRGPHGV